MNCLSQIIKNLSWNGHLPMTGINTENLSSSEYAILILKAKEDELSGTIPFRSTPLETVRHARKYLEAMQAVEEIDQLKIA